MCCWVWLKACAKGRIERLWGTFQDRLSNELRLAHATTIAAAQPVLERFLLHFNDRFAVPAAQPGSAYRPLPAAFAAEMVFCFKYSRTVAADNTISFTPHRLQLLPNADRLSYAPSQGRAARALRWQPGRLLSGPARRPSGGTARSPSLACSRWSAGASRPAICPATRGAHQPASIGRRGADCAATTEHHAYTCARPSLASHPTGPPHPDAPDVASGGGAGRHHPQRAVA